MTTRSVSAGVAPVPLDYPRAPVAQRVQRLVSLDALRGFDMFWIVGGEGIIEGLAKSPWGHTGVVRLLAGQFEHSTWEGVTFYDLIFPLFVFIVGVSLVFSLSKMIERDGKAATVRRIIFRGAALYLLGILYYGGIGDPQGFGHIRLMGVLQRIALAYFFAALIFCFFGLRTMIGITAGLLIGYWALMTFVPVPGEPHHSWAEGHNLTNYLDRIYLRGRKWDGDHDPEGLLSTLPAIGTCMLGVFAGMLLRNPRVAPLRKVGYLMAGGIIAVAIGFAWGLQFPVIKKLWTSSYVLVAGGYGALILAVFYLVIDVLNIRWWTAPFVWIGMNAITLYMAENLLQFRDLALRFVGGDVAKRLGSWEILAANSLAVAFVLLLARFLYKRQIFLRL